MHVGYLHRLGSNYEFWKKKKKGSVRRELLTVIIRYLAHNIFNTRYSLMMAWQNTCNADSFGLCRGVDVLQVSISASKWGVQQRKMCKFGSTWRYQAFLTTAAGTLSFR